MSQPTINDSEVVFRRIPKLANWFEPPDRPTSANFKFNRGDEGLSVYRKSVVTAQEVLEKTDAPDDFFLVQVTAGEIRALVNGSGDRLNLDVVIVDDAEDPGHAEIRGKFTKGASEALKRLFKPT